ncbi:MAG: hypothetical protein ACOC1U_02520 [Spirochaetota bacterium]
MRRCTLIVVSVLAVAAIAGAIDRLRADCGSRFHDAIPAGVRLLERESGARVIVYLTDGADNRSNLTVSNMRQVNVGEDTIVYGMGLGDVDGVPPDDYTIDVGFDRSVWRCTTVAREHTRTLVAAREDDSFGDIRSRVPGGR